MKWFLAMLTELSVMSFIVLNYIGKIPIRLDSKGTTYIDKLEYSLLDGYLNYRWLFFALASIAFILTLIIFFREDLGPSQPPLIDTNLVDSKPFDPSKHEWGHKIRGPIDNPYNRRSEDVGGRTNLYT